MLVSHRYKFIYIKTIKTAGTSTEAFFQKYCLSPEQETMYSPEHTADETVTQYGIIGKRWRGKNGTGKWRNHKLAKDIKAGIGDSMFNEYMKICNIRNPYDIAVSYYHFNGEQKAESRPIDKLFFEKWLKRKDIKEALLSNKNLWAIDGSYEFNYIRQENLKEDIIKVCNKLNISTENIEIPEYKITKTRAPYQEYYTPAAKKIVESIYSKELEVFGYTF